MGFTRTGSRAVVTFQVTGESVQLLAERGGNAADQLQVEIGGVRDAARAICDLAASCALAAFIGESGLDGSVLSGGFYCTHAMCPDTARVAVCATDTEWIINNLEHGPGASLG